MRWCLKCKKNYEQIKRYLGLCVLVGQGFIAGGMLLAWFVQCSFLESHCFRIGLITYEATTDAGKRDGMPLLCCRQDNLVSFDAHHRHKKNRMQEAGLVVAPPDFAFARSKGMPSKCEETVSGFARRRIKI